MGDNSRWDGLGLEAAQRLFAASPQGQLLGIELVDFGEDWVLGRIPYREEMVGNPETGYVHGGVVTTLIDHCSGAAVMLRVGRQRRVVTLDLRVDYLRPAVPGRALHARAECYRAAREVAFVRCTAFEDRVDEPFAASMSSFMHLAEENGPRGVF